MCHGTFDIVHPGPRPPPALRQEQGATSWSPASPPTPTSPRRNFRPYVPQDLRAINLAALEMVDYVVIDRDADAAREPRHHPARLLRQGLRVHQATACIRARPQEEMDVLEAYGGEIIFTPGDIVYSSSQHHRDRAAGDRASRSC